MDKMVKNIDLSKKKRRKKRKIFPGAIVYRSECRSISTSSGPKGEERNRISALLVTLLSRACTQN